jgi:hypothetical protein
METKAKRIAAGVLTGIPALVLAVGGILKIMGREAPSVVEFLEAQGFGDHMALLGLTSVVIAVLLMVPRTKRIGFLLVCCYFGGALAMEISGKRFPVSAFFLTLAWIGMYAGDKQIFYRNFE